MRDGRREEEGGKTRADQRQRKEKLETCSGTILLPTLLGQRQEITRKMLGGTAFRGVA